MFSLKPPLKGINNKADPSLSWEPSETCRFKEQIRKTRHNSVKPTLDILHSLLWDGPWRKKRDEREILTKQNLIYFDSLAHKSAISPNSFPSWIYDEAESAVGEWLSWRCSKWRVEYDCLVLEDCSKTKFGREESVNHFHTQNPVCSSDSEPTFFLPESCTVQRVDYNDLRHSALPAEVQFRSTVQSSEWACLVLIIDACVCICAHSAAAQHDDSVWFSPSRKSVGRESKIDCLHMYNSQIENAVHSDCLTETSSSSEYSMMHNGSKSLFLLPALQNKSAVYFWVNPFKKTKTHSGIIL